LLNNQSFGANALVVKLFCMCTGIMFKTRIQAPTRVILNTMNQCILSSQSTFHMVTKREFHMKLVPASFETLSTVLFFYCSLLL
jgi:hypothetical protein